jgi:hypothetical protein
MSVIDAAAATDPDVCELWRTLVGQGVRG